jgi:hypothetical protein
MKRDSVSTRRWLLKVGAIAAAPLAAAGSAMAMEDAARQARLTRLEDEAAIRALHQDWLRRINAGDRAEAAVEASVRSLRPDLEAARDAIELAPDGRRASGRFHLIAETETALPKDCTLAQMAHAQGEGVIRRSEARLLKVEYAKVGDAWAIAKIELSPT